MGVAEFGPGQVNVMLSARNALSPNSEKQIIQRKKEAFLAAR